MIVFIITAIIIIIQVPLDLYPIFPPLHFFFIMENFRHTVKQSKYSHEQLSFNHYQYLVKSIVLLKVSQGDGR